MTPECMTPAHALHMTRMHHAHHDPSPRQDPCCHVHAGLSDMPAPPVAERLTGLSAEGTRAFLASRQAPAPGGDWLPPLRPQKSGTSEHVTPFWLPPCPVQGGI
ncbi:hypothetical protein RI056_09750 [Komagataeibacter nataicola]|uniref:hypothetical protein n=1 Tax=Komagataeibacter nataicola TaxID=265960 RepID=UPI0028AF401B|nr:hypothetical protein [Komagataeibacter nataicola]WNM07421.1 hypothetical protein RI056_09750 [Komagataeibacter nataicola]